jgi:para-nitrobenzyl esterase
MRGLQVAVVAAAACLVTGFVTPITRAQVPPTVAPLRTQSGLVAGQVLPSGVKAWLGIPFAQPPTQSLRWRPPQPFQWQGVWNADRTMPECIQVLRPHNINHYFGEEPTSENCLYLNIWAPAKSTEGSRLPVVVFIHGGGFTIGSSGSPLYAGEPLARHGVVFVNFNYRLGILGFLAHPELTHEQGGHSGDYGFLDQVAALKWIHDNIARFGGDPSRVLISGQSAGAGSVSAQIFSPLARGLFQAAFLSSGCNWTGNGTPLAQAESTGLQVQKLLGTANLEAMRQVPADKLLALQAENQVMASNPGVRVGPIIDGYFAPAAPQAILEAHGLNDVPIIATSNGQDLDTAMSPLVAANTVAEYHDIATRLYGADAPEFLRLYPVTRDEDVKEVASRAARDGGMQGNARKCAQLQSRYASSAAYLSLFTHKHPYIPGVVIADQNTATIAAYHTADIPYWFGTLDVFNLIRPTRDWQPWDRELAEDMMSALVAFAKTGNPSTAALRWPAWRAGDEKRAIFGERVTIESLDTQRMDWLAAHPAARPASGPGGAGPRD